MSVTLSAEGTDRAVQAEEAGRAKRREVRRLLSDSGARVAGAQEHGEGRWDGR